MPRRDEGAVDPVRFKPQTEATPVEEPIGYVHYLWFQQLVPVRSTCYRCHCLSPVVFCPRGALAFGNPRMLRRTVDTPHKERDITREAITAFADVGWKLQLRRAYCPDCKNLGSV
ncbi:MAG TPA: hypothetical protein VGH29_04770 [Candidatus Binataceae bacterium]|jgi:hypothetical protein